MPKTGGLGWRLAFLMGIAFVVGPGGCDTYEMWQASAASLAEVGAGCAAGCTAGRMLAGWLVARSDNALVGLVSLAAERRFCSVIGLGHVPYELVLLGGGKALTLIFKVSHFIPFNESALTRLWIAAALSGVLLAIGGALQTMVVDAARTTSL